MCDVEKGVANKWRWEWMEKMVEVADPSKQYPKLKWTHGSVKVNKQDFLQVFQKKKKKWGLKITFERSMKREKICRWCITNDLITQKRFKNLGDLYNKTR